MTTACLAHDARDSRLGREVALKVVAIKVVAIEVVAGEGAHDPA